MNKNEFIEKELFSGKHDGLTVAQFGRLVNEVWDNHLKRQAKFSDDVQLGAMAEDEKYAKQVERAADILAEAQDTAEEFDMNEDDMFDLADDMYDRASSNKGELI